ncbi:hypothetical protein SLA2020_301100 [Shorea laevis]
MMLLGLSSLFSAGLQFLMSCGICVLNHFLNCQTTKGMKSDNGVAEEVKLDSNQSMPEKKLEAYNFFTEEKFRRGLCSD